MLFFSLFSLPAVDCGAVETVPTSVGCFLWLWKCVSEAVVAARAHERVFRIVCFDLLIFFVQRR